MNREPWEGFCDLPRRTRTGQARPISRGLKRLLLAVLIGLTFARAAPLPWGPIAHAAPGGQEGPEVAKARAHFKAGERAFNAGDYAKALAEFEAGYALVPRPGFLLNMAHTERRLGNPARARDIYQRYLEVDPQSARRDEVLGLIAELDRTLGGLRSPSSSSASVPSPLSEPPSPSSSGPEPSAFDSAAASPRPAAPAPRDEPPPVVSARPPASESDVSDSRDTSESLPPARPIHRRWWFWAALGAVAVGTATAVVLGTRPNDPSFQSDGSLGRVGSP
jgi:hypothetical protein